MLFVDHFRIHWRWLSHSTRFVWTE